MGHLVGQSAGGIHLFSCRTVPTGQAHPGLHILGHARFGSSQVALQGVHRKYSCPSMGHVIGQSDGGIHLSSCRTVPTGQAHPGLHIKGHIGLGSSQVALQGAHRWNVCPSILQRVHWSVGMQFPVSSFSTNPSLQEHPLAFPCTSGFKFVHVD